MTAPSLTPVRLEQLRRFSTCLIASAIERFQVRLPNTGFSDSSIRCVFDDLPPVVGYAATARIRTSDPPMEGGGYLYDRADWWKDVLTVPAPRIVVIQDVDSRPGLGALIGEVHANILQALGCVGVVTNGAVRDVNAVRASGFQMLAGNISVSHAYAHIFDFGGAVEVARMTIRPGDLLQADRHGVVSIPAEIADQIPPVAADLADRRHQIVDLCRSSDFSIEKLHEYFQKNLRGLRPSRST
ncbi:MAG: RraA family protein [Candidatus Acidiferrales bacterium]